MKVQRFLEQVASDVTRDAFVAAHPHPVLIEVEAQGGAASGELGVTERIDSSYVQRQSRASTDAAVLPVAVAAGGSVLIGRAPHCDHVIDHPSVSKEHARFTHEPGGLTLIDLGSTNGTFVNGRRLAAGEAVLVRPDDGLRFGKATGFHLMDPDGFFHYLGVLRRFGL